jgi:endonuclease/exonuclease/phosphatase family metal-dependent hydrolase
VGGTVKVATFNSLNWFTTLGSRGASTLGERDRQLAKLVAAITALDADILGIQEIENNGNTAIGALVDALNGATAPGTYAFIDDPDLGGPGVFGADQIKVAVIYQPAVVAPVGGAATSADAVFDRPPLIQTFEPTGGGEDVTVAVNHFKSKSCTGATGLDLDQGDGQGCFNARRTAQADALATALATLAVPNPLVLGDLNSFTQEGPIASLEGDGYADLGEAQVPAASRYSFVIDGFSGALDHAMASAGILDDVTGAAFWHINADEPTLFDYNTELKTVDPYAPDAYRSSDHDPLLIGLDLGPDTPVVVPSAPTVSALMGVKAATISWDEPDDGGSDITGYVVEVRVGRRVKRTITVGPDVRDVTVGSLEKTASYNFRVVAQNAIGDGPAGTATGATFVPGSMTLLDLSVACPTFSVANANAYPVSYKWVDKSVGRVHTAHSDVVEANGTDVLDGLVARTTGPTKVLVKVLDVQQELLTTTCPP